jgi:hypothetical protein
MFLGLNSKSSNLKFGSSTSNLIVARFLLKNAISFEEANFSKVFHLKQDCNANGKSS